MTRPSRRPTKGPLKHKQKNKQRQKPKQIHLHHIYIYIHTYIHIYFLSIYLFICLYFLYVIPWQSYEGMSIPICTHSCGHSLMRTSHAGILRDLLQTDLLGPKTGIRLPCVRAENRLKGCSRTQTTRLPANNFLLKTVSKSWALLLAAV